MALCSLSPSRHGVVTNSAGPPSSVSARNVSTASWQRFWKAGFSTRSSGG